MKALPPPPSEAPQPKPGVQLPTLPERRAPDRATPGQPFGRRQADQTILSHTYPAPFVAQAAGASLERASGPEPSPRASARPNPYQRQAPLGLVSKVKA